MKNKCLRLLLTLLTAVSLLSVPAFAEEYTGSDNWNVTFTAAKKMESNFRTVDMDESIYAMQPGDIAHFTVHLKNICGETTYWYMTNKVLKSLEDSQKVANGGGYSYRLVYTDVSGKQTVLYDSDAVGGEKDTSAGEGLHEATDSLDEYFYLDELKTNQSGTINLDVSLDGETQGNAYQDTLAELQMNFAVELTQTTPNRVTNNRQITQNTTRTVTQTTGNTVANDGSTIYTSPKTGDWTDIIPYVISLLVGGIVLLFAVRSLHKDKKKWG